MRIIQSKVCRLESQTELFVPTWLRRLEVSILACSGVRVKSDEL